MNLSSRILRNSLYIAALAFSAVSVSASAETLLSLNKKATASTKDNSSRVASKAVDGNTGSRWASYPVDSTWFTVDLGKTFDISRVKLNWEAAYGKGYKIQVSNDGSKWTDVFSTTTGNGDIDDLSVSGNGRYVRMLGTERGTKFGYSLWEFEVYGAESTGGGNVSSSSSSSSSSSAKSSSSSSSSSSANSSSSAPASSSSSAKSSSSSSKSSTPSTGGVTLEWFIPDARENGEYLELSDIGGYELRYKKVTDTEYTTIFIEDGSVDSYTLNKLNGDYEFSIAAYDTDGLFSEFVTVEPRS